MSNRKRLAFLLMSLMLSLLCASCKSNIQGNDNSRQGLLYDFSSNKIQEVLDTCEQKESVVITVSSRNDILLDAYNVHLKVDSIDCLNEMVEGLISKGIDSVVINIKSNEEIVLIIPEVKRIIKNDKEITKVIEDLFMEGKDSIFIHTVMSEQCSLKDWDEVCGLLRGVGFVSLDDN